MSVLVFFTKFVMRRQQVKNCPHLKTFIVYIAEATKPGIVYVKVYVHHCLLEENLRPPDRLIVCTFQNEQFAVETIQIGRSETIFRRLPVSRRVW